VNATSSIVIQVIVVIVIAVRAVMMMVMMPTTLMVMVIIGGIRLARWQWVTSVALCDRWLPIDFRYSPVATEVMRRRKMLRRAKTGKLSAAYASKRAQLKTGFSYAPV
jgi:hypothetical protein